MNEHAPDAKTFLTRDRLDAALDATDMPNTGPEDPALHLTDTERRSIDIALANSSRAIARFAHQLLDMYDELPPRHQYEALDLFANVVHNPHRNALALGAQSPAPDSNDDPALREGAVMGRVGDLPEAVCTDCGKVGCAGFDLGDPLCFRCQVARLESLFAYRRKQRDERGISWDRYTVERWHQRRGRQR